MTTTKESNMRNIIVNGNQVIEYCDNTIKTAKYNSYK